ncbi:glycosyltransferase [Winogradskyella sp.]|uniref:glycosyltransferase n=1 Tax=Winogradskyella sp. TaxID=1883156 RepID=UPI003AB4936D
MRVLFVISVRGHGRGGHFHSLNHIAAALGENTEVGICSFGVNKSEVISNNSLFKKHFLFNGKNIFSLKREINKYIKEFKPDIIHCFDINAYNLLTLLVDSKNNIVLNHCGGPNPVEFPFVENLILFSKENQTWFENQNKFQKSSIYLIPNRVNKKELVLDKALRPLTKKDVFCFVRISRIGKVYKKSIEDSIRLIEQTKKKGADVHLYIIGTIEDEMVFSNFKLQCENLPVTFLTDNVYTKKASNMLYLADAVIATGRGVMEATGLGIPILTPAKNATLPILVSKNNFESFLATNFSQRNVSNKVDIQTNLIDICRLIEDKETYKALKNESMAFFDKYFDVEGAVPKYIEVYKNVIDQPKTNKRKLMNFKYQLKTIYSFLKNG